MSGPSWLRRFILAIAPVVILALGAAPVAGATTTTFSSPGEQSFVVPAGITSVHLVAIGARGGSGATSRGGAGGLGDRVEGDLGVTPGQVLYVDVGGVGGDASGTVPGAGGANGGGLGGSGEVDGGTVGGAGGGGGASDVRTAPGSLQSRLLVAGGGGGGGAAGGNESLPGGGDGGAGASNGETVSNPPDENSAGTGGGGATATTAGKGGLDFGHDGSFGVGGSGQQLSGPNEGAATGGGGGGGAFGGGSGGSSQAKGGSGGGGGGGSDFFDPRVTNAAVVREADEPALVTITYTAATIPAPAPIAPIGPPVAPVLIAPQTKLKKHPAKLVKTDSAQVKVSFEFASSVAGSSFRCKLDKGAFKLCKSPQAYEVGPGPHVFKVAASAAGLADATPAIFRFKVKRNS